MKTLDLRQEDVTVEDLLRLASADSVLILDSAGREFLLEDVHEFEREVRELGGSERFAEFLRERSEEAGCISLDEFEAGLTRDSVQ